ncbi:respiratory nitrate reductase subunit gamma [Streptomyces sp. NPDC056682]|uniref:respiratory nitrate reductase subunit gamma n=1 Tax=Streptomyces sp. NPDC056682 TaxID=3345909 RepID=UPI0036C43BCD
MRHGADPFHYGLLFVIGGHIAGLLVPEALTDRLHVSEEVYHANALFAGGAARIAAVYSSG